MFRCLTLMLLAATFALVGCQTGPVGRIFAKPDRTTYRTPRVRAEEARSLAAESSGLDATQQQELLNRLARDIQSETDPLVREALVESIAAFPMPLAGQVLEAGLADRDAGVRGKCCAMLGARGDASAAAALERIIRSDDDIDVRVAATQALGQINGPESSKALVAALEDSSPALQYAGVQAMRKSTGRDLGGEVAAYLAYARGEEAPAVATKPESGAGGYLRRFSPF